jgi:hypothetical protein
MQAEKLHKEDGEPLPFSRAQYELKAVTDLLDNLFLDIVLCDKCKHVVEGDLYTPCTCEA